MLSIVIILHALAAVFWVGGMFFAYMVLRPAAGSALSPQTRARLWGEVLARFFPWVWLAIGVLLASGLWMLFYAFGGIGAAGIHILLMLGLGFVMMLIFAHVYTSPYRRLRRAINDNNWEAAADRLEQVRGLFRFNLWLGIVVIVIGVGGRYL